MGVSHRNGNGLPPSTERTPALPLPESLEDWDIGDVDDPDTASRKFLACRNAWKSLASFFSSKGYMLYQTRPRGSNLDPPTIKNSRRGPVHYPYASLVPGRDQNMSFGSGSGAVRVWPAVDFRGRHVVIKVVADDQPSSELEVLEFLDSEDARADPRNHTIPIIEFLRYEKWGQAFWPDFGTIRELLHFTHSFLEAFDFLHENRIIHGDFLEQNTAMDVLYPDGHWYIKGLRDPSLTRYVLIDFGLSVKYPRDSAIEDIQEARDYNFQRRGIPNPGRIYNPFKVDIIGLGLILQRWVRHIENIVPEIGPFFEGMVTPDVQKRFTAREALDSFEKIFSALTEEQLNKEVISLWWNDGVIREKEGEQVN